MLSETRRLLELRLEMSSKVQSIDLLHCAENQFDRVDLRWYWSSTSSKCDQDVTVKTYDVKAVMLTSNTDSVTYVYQVVGTEEVSHSSDSAQACIATFLMITHSRQDTLFMPVLYLSYSSDVTMTSAPATTSIIAEFVQRMNKTGQIKPGHLIQQLFVDYAGRYLNVRGHRSLTSPPVVCTTLLDLPPPSDCKVNSITLALKN
jgi:hypothetical protein